MEIFRVEVGLMTQNNCFLEKLKILVVDDHPLILDGTFNILSKHYPNAEILIAKTAQDVTDQIKNNQLDLVAMDLSIPQKPEMTAQVETGIELVQNLMKDYPHLNILVHSSYIKALIRIKHDIDSHRGGFTIADKGLSTQELLTRINWALEGVTHTKGLSTTLEVKPEWLEVLRLAFEEGLQDKAIASQMNISERTVRHYWTKIQDVLDIYPEDSKQEGKNIRIHTEIRAREEGFID